MKITKTQIEQLAHNARHENNKLIVDDLKQWFPEAFKTELEVGKWYKWNDRSVSLLWCITKIEDKEIHCYGFYNSEWRDKGVGYSSKYYEEAVNNLKPATDKEVEEALINEAVKRGFKDGVWIKTISESQYKAKGFGKLEVAIGKDFTSVHYENTYNVFCNGKWAEIIPTLTKEEAEKKLNCKII